MHDVKLIFVIGDTSLLHTIKETAQPVNLQRNGPSAYFTLISGLERRRQEQEDAGLSPISKSLYKVTSIKRIIGSVVNEHRAAKSKVPEKNSTLSWNQVKMYSHFFGILSQYLAVLDSRIGVAMINNDILINDRSVMLHLCLHSSNAIYNMLSRLSTMHQPHHFASTTRVLPAGLAQSRSCKALDLDK